MFYLGIDIAKTNHVASLLDQDGKVVIRNIKFTNSNEGYKTLLEIVSSKVDDLSLVLVGMEATGHYWLSIFSSLVGDNFNVSVFNPYQIKSYRSSYSLRKQKNDVIDSIIISDYLRVFGTESSNLPVEDILALKQLTRFRSNMVDNIVSLKTQVIGILDKVFPEYESLFCDIFGNSSKQILLECPTPEDIIKINTTKLSNILSKYSKGKFGKNTALNLKEIAKVSFGTKYASNACSFEIKQIVNQIIFLESQIEDLDVKIKELYDNLDSHLLSVPGVGKVLAPVILSFES